MTQIVAIDIGGTHARFALAEIADGKVVSLGDPVTLKTADHASFQTAWEAFCAGLEGVAPRIAAIAVAGPVQGEVIKFTNNPWIIQPALIREQLGVDDHILINDFAAVGHAVANAGTEYFVHLCGPDQPLPTEGAISIIGPGTGLGVACLHRHGQGYRVQPTEGGHIDFAPLDAIEDVILAHLRKRYRRVSAERIVAGPALKDIYQALAEIENRTVQPFGDKALWQAAMEGSDSLAAAALERFCMSLGSIAGDIALAQGGSAVVIAGGLGFRLKDILIRSGFASRFVAKGRFESLMASLPVKIITHPEPGLLGAAAAFAVR